MQGMSRLSVRDGLHGVTPGRFLGVVQHGRLPGQVQHGDKVPGHQLQRITLGTATRRQDALFDSLDTPKLLPTLEPFDFIRESPKLDHQIDLVDLNADSARAACNP